MSILSKLFGSADRLKLIRLFLLNPEDVFLPKEVSARAKISPQSARRELNLLSSVGFIRREKATIEISTGAEGKTKKKKIEGWSIDPSFPLLYPLKRLVLDTTPLSRKEFLRKINKTGTIKLAVLSGIFIQKDNSRVDLLIVGDKIKKNLLEKVLREIEAEIGKELVYAVFDTSDFIYRLNMCDKFVRDILDYPHEKLTNKLNV